MWFSELSETHTTFSILAFFRSPNPHRSWVTSAGAVLDARRARAVDARRPVVGAGRACASAPGYLALREIADIYRIPYDPDPAPDDPISIAKAEFMDAYERLGGAGVPVRTDRERGVARLRGLARELRRRAARARRAHDRAVRAVVVGPLAQRASASIRSSAAAAARTRRRGSDPR